MTEDVAGAEPYLLVEEVAARLGLPLSVLLHRVEAGDIPSRRLETEDGLHYALRLSDLGIELDDEGMRASAMGGRDEDTMSATFEPSSVAPAHSGVVFDLTESAPVETAVPTFNGDPQPAWISPRAEPEPRPAPVWSLRPREPQEPPEWIIREPAAGEEGAVDQGPSGAEAEAQPELELAMEPASAPPPGEAGDEVAGDADAASPAMDDGAAGLDVLAGGGATEAEDDGIPALVHAADVEPEDDLDEDTVTAQLAVPPPSRSPLGMLDAGAQGPRGDLASMSLDARELVAGLLDRWERTLEQRIYTEQRQRFQAELVARQNMVKQLQMELHTARAEHAALQAEKDRALAGKERELADRERDLAETRRQAEEAQRLLVPVARRRRWFRGRDD